MTAMNTQERIAELSQALPAWTFQPYGKTGAIVCYPPAGQWNVGFAAQNALGDLAPIAGIVSGNGLVVCQLRREPVGSGPHPLAVF
jgi:hypothetical protein